MNSNICKDLTILYTNTSNKGICDTNNKTILKNRTISNIYKTRE